MSYDIGNISLTVAGESHAAALSVILEGIKSGIEIDKLELLRFMQRRAPGKDRFSTTRKEADVPIILSGIKDGYTTGSPISAIIENNNTRSEDYGEKLNLVRPGHADYPASVKFGDSFNFHGGGQFSGRLTAALCFAGAIAKQVLSKRGVSVNAHISSIYGIEDESYKNGICDISLKAFPVISDEMGEKMMQAIDHARNNGDSVGGSIECAVSGLPAGIGDALYEGIDGEISKAVFAIPAVKGIEFGAGFEVCSMLGSENNDSYYVEDDVIKTRTNNHGGVLGGMTTGMPILFNVAIKPTPSISKEQDTVSIIDKSSAKLQIKGRHDPCIVQRAVPVVEAMAALAVLGKIDD